MSIVEEAQLKMKVAFEISPTTNENEFYEKDAFEQLYANGGLNAIFGVLYFLGYLCCLGLGLVIWFERSGQAGPYRTLVNQLVTHRLESIILIYIFPLGLVNLRMVRL